MTALLFVNAQAQEIPKDKTFEISTSSGVNLHDLQYSFVYNDISIGSGQFPSKLDLQRKYEQVPYYPVYYSSGSTSAPFASHSSHNFSLTANCFPCDMGWQQDGNSYSSQPEHFMTVKAFDGVHSFKSTPTYWGTARTWTNRYDDGATLSDDGDHVVLTTKAGDQIIFSHTEPGGAGLACGGACAVAMYAIFASGETIVFNYDKLPTPPAANNIFWYQAPAPMPTTAWGTSRLTSVVNSRGYGLAFQYVNPSLTTGDMQTRTLVSGVSGFRSGCVSGVVECTSGAMPQVLYSYTANVNPTAPAQKAYRLTSFQDVNGKNFAYEYNGPELRLSKAFQANSSQSFYLENTYDQTPPDQYGYYSGKVVSQKNALLQVTTYSGGSNYSDTSPTSTTVTNPDGSSMVLYFNGQRGLKYTLPSRVELPMGKVQLYSYDLKLRLTSATDPAGILESYTLDSRGNVTQLTRTPKPGSIEAATSQTWSYPACTSATTKICNKPQFYVDSRLNRTDYSYDSNHGGLLAELLPANAQNLRAVKRYYYSSYYPAPNVVAPAGMSLVLANLTTAVDTCTTSTVSGTAIDFNFTCPVASRSRTSFTYTPSTSATRTNFELERSTEIADSQNLATCFRYDSIGNLISRSTPAAMC